MVYTQYKIHSTIDEVPNRIEREIQIVYVAEIVSTALPKTIIKTVVRQKQQRESKTFPR